MAAKDRTSIPEKVAADVLYQSDHTCCMCRIGKSVQIHHLDENPTDHDPDNLAVLCINCHHETQLRGGFTRKPLALEIKRYRESWYRLVKLRLDPHSADEAKRIFIAEAMYDVIDIAHGWRNSLRYVIDPQALHRTPDAWANALELVPQTYSAEVFERLKPFFEAGLARVIEILDRVQIHCGDGLPWEFRTLILRTRRELEADTRRYASFQKSLVSQAILNDRGFAAQFEGVLRVLRQLAESAERVQRDHLGDDLSLYDGPEEEYDPYG